MTRGRLAVHAHFYQPERRDPFGGPARPDPTAAPHPSWSARIAAECYRPLAENGTFERISFNVGPTLSAALATEDPGTLARIAAAGDGGGNAVAQGFHHAILPLASARDRRTEIRWGLRDFAVRFGHPAAGFWLPEAAADTAVLRALAEEGVRWTVLAPWQAAGGWVETRSPHRVDLGDGRSLVVAFYDTDLSSAISFQPDVTADADRFARDWVLPRTREPLHVDGEATHDAGAPLVVIATDGELYGHHQAFRDLFLGRLVDPEVDRDFDVVLLGRALEAEDSEHLPAVRIADRTSWSCHHGVLRWSGECGCAADARWKQPLRAALERLAGAVDAVTESRLQGIDAWAARDAYVEVVLGLEAPADFAARIAAGGTPGPGATIGDRARAVETLMEAQRWRLAMFASCGWYWEDPTRPETAQILRSAARAAHLVDDLAGTALERRLVEDLAAITAPGGSVDGATLYRDALAVVGQRVRT